MSDPLSAPAAPAGEDELWRRILHRAAGLTDPDVGETKAALARELATEVGNESLDALADLVAAENEDLTWSGGAARAADIGLCGERRATALIVLAGAWESSGATKRALGVALYLTAARLFDLDEEQLRERADPDAVARADSLLANYGAVLSAFITAQYERTQDLLAGLGAVAAARGYIHRGTPSAEVIIASPPLLPLASFSLDPHIATDFPFYPRPLGDDDHFAVALTEVPAARILTTPVTGIASLHEHELVVLGPYDDRDRAWIFLGHDQQRVSIASADDAWARLPKANSADGK